MRLICFEHNYSHSCIARPAFTAGAAVAAAAAAAAFAVAIVGVIAAVSVVRDKPLCI